MPQSFLQTHSVVAFVALFNKYSRTPLTRMLSGFELAGFYCNLLTLQSFYSVICLYQSKVVQEIVRSSQVVHQVGTCLQFLQHGVFSIPTRCQTASSLAFAQKSVGKNAEQVNVQVFSQLYLFCILSCILPYGFLSKTKTACTLMRCQSIEGYGQH